MGKKNEYEIRQRWEGAWRKVPLPDAIGLTYKGTRAFASLLMEKSQTRMKIVNKTKQTERELRYPKSLYGPRNYHDHVNSLAMTERKYVRVYAYYEKDSEELVIIGMGKIVNVPWGVKEVIWDLPPKMKKFLAGTFGTQYIGMFPTELHSKEIFALRVRYDDMEGCRVQFDWSPGFNRAYGVAFVINPTFSQQIRKFVDSDY